MKWTNTTITLGQLKPWSDNPKTSSKKDARALLKSWDELGQFQTIAIGPGGEVYDGHQRLSALLTAHGADYVVEARQADRALTDEERRKIALYSRQIGAWDWDALSNWQPAELMEWGGFDADTLKDWKRDVAALDNFLKSEKPEPADAEAQIDRAEELNEKWQVKTGDLWRIGEHRLLCGDSTKREDVERVTEGGVDCTVTDPPYGVGVSYDTFEDTVAKTKELIDGFMPHVLDRLPASIVTGVMNLFDYPRPKWIGTWVHPAAMAPGPWGFNGNNPILYYGKDPYLSIGKGSHPDSVVMAADREGVDGHPTPKPLKMWEWLIERMTPEQGAKVYEPFGGSGTGLVACQNLSRKCRAIEISPNYCAVILERMATAFPELTIERIEA